MATLKTLCAGNNYRVMPPQLTPSDPMVLCRVVKSQYRLTFLLKKLVPGQTFLGIYPATATLPDASGLHTGDYALLDSGEVLQII